MTAHKDSPGPRRGFPLADAGVSVNPVGLFAGAAARQAVAAGTADRLAGGWLAFDRAEIIRDSADGGVAIAPGGRDDIPSAIRANLTRSRADFAGLALDRPRIAGIVNVTPDSFSDGGDTADPAAAIDRALALAGSGADFVDIGGESTRPGARAIGVGEELDRVMPVVEAAVAAGHLVSIDTRRAAVMQAAIGAGAGIVNDVTALAGDPRSLDVVAAAGVAVILMHMQGEPATMQAAPAYRLASHDILGWLAARVAACEAAGIARGRIAVDPGIGFGKTDVHNTEILNRLALFQGLGCAVMAGVSRKSFIGRLAGMDDPKARLPGTIAATAVAAARGAQLHRVHDVAETRQALAIVAAIHENG